MKAFLIAELILLALAGRHGEFSRDGEALIFVPLLLMAGACFLGAVRRSTSALDRRVMWGAAIAFRLAMLACAPCDDFPRYAWEGRVQNAGFNPYVLRPASPELARLRDDTWWHINHTDTAAIYPPLAEATFSAITLVSTSPLAFKLVFVAADLLTLALLLKLVSTRDAAWYAWNPAVIYAFAGAAHFDSLLLLALTAAIVALENRRFALSATALGLAIAVKIVPIFLFPVWAFAFGKRAWLLVIAALIPAALTLPYGGPDIVLDSLRSFADVSRFNELFVWIFPNPWQRNWPVTTLLCLVAAGLTWHFRRDWSRGALWVFGSTLILSPVLHPWYATWILPLAVWRRQPAWTVLSISAISALLLWETTPLWAAWHPNAVTRALVILPPLAVWRFRSTFHEPAHV